jgi:hypothetical protein
VHVVHLLLVALLLLLHAVLLLLLLLVNVQSMIRMVGPRLSGCSIWGDMCNAGPQVRAVGRGHAVQVLGHLGVVAVGVEPAARVAAVLRAYPCC